MASAFTRAVEAAAEPLERHLPESLKAHSSTIVVVAGSGVAYLTLRRLTKTFYKSNPFNFGRTGALSADEINKSIVDYEKFFDQKQGAGIKDGQVAGKKKSNTPEFVDKFYRHAPGAAPARQLRPARAGCQASAVRWRLHMPAAQPLRVAPASRRGGALRLALPRTRSRRARRPGAALGAGKHARSAGPSRWSAAGRPRAAARPPGCRRARGADAPRQLAPLALFPSARFPSRHDERLTRRVPGLPPSRAFCLHLPARHRSMITDFYEYGWGQSFHFAPRNKGESFDVRAARRWRPPMQRHLRAIRATRPAHARAACPAPGRRPSSATR
jgi:hypothetical protein